MKKNERSLTEDYEHQDRLADDGLESDITFHTFCGGDGNMFCDEDCCKCELSDCLETMCCCYFL